MTSTSISFGTTQKGKPKLIDAEGHTYIGNNKSKEKNIEYWKCTNKGCRGRFIYYPASGEGKLSVSHSEDKCELNPYRKERDEAIERIKELTLSAEGGVKAIQLVRRVLKQLSPEVRAAMPSEDLLIQRVYRWAKANNIQMERTTAEDYLLLEAEEPLTAGYQEHGTSEKVTEKSGALEKKRRPKGSTNSRKTLRRVDEHGNVIGAASLDEFVYGNETEWQEETSTHIETEKSNQRNVNTRDTTCDDNEHDFTGNDDGYMDDAGGDDFHMDFEPDESEEFVAQTQQPNNPPQKHSSIVCTSSKPITKSPPKPPPTDNVKSGELCVVCGDELIVSEKLAASQEIFKKACCYLNVKSEGEWFPRTNSSGFYSFCEFCTNEIIKIHSLYKKVEEIQSLIFKKVETVEKRIADAEIVDNWMAEAPRASAIRFEGFRKQVMINYRNKLKLRREIRYGKKIGRPLIEVQPSSSANMFLNDPCTNDLPGNVIPDNGSENNIEPTHLRKTRGRPKSKKPVEDRQDIEIREHKPVVEPNLPAFPDSPMSNNNDADDYLHDFDDNQDDVMSNASEREVKFWQDDLSKLDVKRRKSPRGNNARAYRENESDPDYNDELDKRESTPKKTKPYEFKQRRQFKTTGKGESKKAASSSRVTKNKYFPEALLSKDGRVFLQGVEIIKNPPGAYKARPYSVSFTCGACGKVVLKFWAIRAHICGHHLGMYKCQLCSREFTNPQTMQRHVVNYHGQRKYENCPECGKPVRIYKSSMEFHRWCHLNEEERKDPKFKRWCPPRYKDPKRLIPKQSFMCGQCGKNFHFPSALRKHELTHDPNYAQITLLCQYCGKSFNNRSNWQKHVANCARKVQGKVPQSYPCSKCPARFTTCNARSVHMRRRHRNFMEFPFSCPKCPRKFSCRVGFNNHKRVCIDGERGYNTHGKSSSSDQASLAPRASAGYSETKYDASDSNDTATNIQGQDQSYPVQSTSSTPGFGAAATNFLGFNYHFLGGN